MGVEQAVAGYPLLGPDPALLSGSAWPLCPAGGGPAAAIPGGLMNQHIKPHRYNFYKSQKHCMITFDVINVLRY